MEAEVIQLPVAVPVRLSCLECQNVFLGSKGLICGEYMEVLVHDEVAQDCNAYEPFN